MAIKCLHTSLPSFFAIPISALSQVHIFSRTFHCLILVYFSANSSCCKSSEWRNYIFALAKHLLSHQQFSCSMYMQYTTLIISVRKTFSNWETSFELSGLKPDAQYSVEMAALSKAGAGEFVKYNITTSTKSGAIIVFLLAMTLH